MLSDLIAPARLRAGDPQALALLVAVGGWSVVSYCERAGARDDVASAVVLSFVTFRRRAIESAADTAPDLERMLLESARDAVDELAGDTLSPADARAAEGEFARASPRPLSPRLATHILRALVESAPVGGEPLKVRAAAEASYAEAYDAADPAPAVAGEERLAVASQVLLRAAQARAPQAPEAGVQDDAAAAPPPAAPGPEAAERASDGGGLPPLRPARPNAARTRPSPLGPLAGVRPAWLAAGAAALVLIALVLFTGDEQGPTGSTVTQTATVTVTETTAAEPTTTTTPTVAAEVLRGTPREPLTASGARYEVVPITDAGWAKAIRARPRRTTYRWVTVAVRMRNVDRNGLALRDLGYRLRTRSGTVIGPLVTELTGSNGKLEVGKRASVHLGFEVGPNAGTLTFAFEPGGLAGPTVLVPLGSGA